MHQALSIPEVLTIVFHLLDEDDLFRCVMVCKKWMDAALDPLWREVDLWAILSTFPSFYRDMTDHSIGFVRPIKPGDWERFAWYGRRVRVLDLHLQDSAESLPMVFAEMALKKPSPVILPNLRRLNIFPYNAKTLAYPLLFMTENVTELQFCPPEVLRRNLYGDLSEYVSCFFTEATKRLPKLQSCTLTAPSVCGVDTRDTRVIIPNNLEKFLLSAAHLNEFVCFPYLITPKVMEALAALTHLRVIRMERDEWCGLGERWAVLPFNPSLSSDSFPSLIELSICATFQDLTSLFQLNFAPRLEALHVHSPQGETADSTHQLLLLLSVKRPHLTGVHISSFGSHTEGYVGAPYEDTDINESVLAPLLEFPRLVQLRITYHQGLTLSNASLNPFLLKWSGLEQLDLCSDPIHSGSLELTPAILPVIAECCPKLRHLSIRINTHVDEESRPPSRFRWLETIGFGTSFLEKKDILDFALFLSEVIPPTCDIESLNRVNWGCFAELELFKEELKIRREDWKVWRELSRALSLFMKARSWEQHRVREPET